MQSILRILIALNVVPFAGSCGSDTTLAESAVSQTQSEISGGVNDPNIRSVVGLATFGGGGFGICSGSLIAPNVVLTAFHCIAPPTNSYGGSDCNNTGFGNPYSAQSVRVTTGQTIGRGSKYYVSQIVTPPGSGVCGRDVALLILDSPVPSSDTKPLVPRLIRPSAQVIRTQRARYIVLSDMATRVALAAVQVSGGGETVSVRCVSAAHVLVQQCIRIGVDG